MDVFSYMPLELWKDMAERFLDPTSFGRLRQVNRALRDKLDEESKKKMVKRCTITITYMSGVHEIFMNRKHFTRENGDQYWFKNDKLHRDDDLPAIVYVNGGHAWYKDGQLYRTNNIMVIPREIETTSEQSKGCLFCGTMTVMSIMLFCLLFLFLNRG